MILPDTAIEPFPLLFTKGHNFRLDKDGSICTRQNKCGQSIEKEKEISGYHHYFPLTLSQTTNFRLFQTERV